MGVRVCRIEESLSVELDSALNRRIDSAIDGSTQMLDTDILAQDRAYDRRRDALELPNLRRRVCFEAARRLFNIGDGSMNRAEMLILDLDHFTPGEYRGECVLAYSSQLIQHREDLMAHR